MPLPPRRARTRIAAALLAVGVGGWLPGPVGIAQAADPVIGAAGDIACDPDNFWFNHGKGSRDFCRQKYTAELLVDGDYDGVLALGDTQYEFGKLRAFRRSYDKSWGKLRDVTHPVPGNHEFFTKNARGYFHYFGDAAGRKPRGWYSFDLGDWHLVALNSTCLHVGCGPGSKQVKWLKDDLRDTDADCTLAFFHVPRFSSGIRGNDHSVRAFWATLYERGADVILNGHDHIYERFAKQNHKGRARDDGIRQFTVGTGGRELYGVEKVRRNSEERHTKSYGILELTLGPVGYAWEFIPERGDYTDSGDDSCSPAA